MVLSLYLERRVRSFASTAASDVQRRSSEADMLCPRFSSPVIIFVLMGFRDVFLDRTQINQNSRPFTSHPCTSPPREFFLTSYVEVLFVAEMYEGVFLWCSCVVLRTAVSQKRVGFHMSNIRCVLVVGVIQVCGTSLPCRCE